MTTLGSLLKPLSDEPVRALHYGNPAALAFYLTEGRWVPARHLVLLALWLGRLARRDIKRLLVLMPPRHGKSNLGSEWFPTWYLGLWPDDRVILTSYEADFAATWGRKVRDHLTEFGPAHFNISIAEDSSAKNRWDIVGRGGRHDDRGRRRRHHRQGRTCRRRAESGRSGCRIDAIDPDFIGPAAIEGAVDLLSGRCMRHGIGVLGATTFCPRMSGSDLVKFLPANAATARSRRVVRSSGCQRFAGANKH